MHVIERVTMTHGCEVSHADLERPKMYVDSDVYVRFTPTPNLWNRHYFEFYSSGHYEVGC